MDPETAKPQQVSEVPCASRLETEEDRWQESSAVWKIPDEENKNRKHSLSIRT